MGIPAAIQGLSRLKLSVHAVSALPPIAIK